MKMIVKLAPLLAIALAPTPGAAQSRVYTFAESRSFSGSFVQSGYNVSSDAFGNIVYGDLGSTVNGACFPNTDCAISTGGTSNPSPTLFAANSTSSLTDVNYDMQRGTSAFAYASLYTGLLGAFASGQSRGCPGYECGVNSSAIAQIGENVHFIVAGADASTHTSIGFTFDVDGELTTDTNSFAQALLRLFPAGNNPAEFLAQVNSSGALATSANGWTTYSISPSTPGHFLFTGYYDLVGATLDMGIGYSLLARSGTGLSDYGSTGRFGFILPDNVSFTSDSGVFLTGDATSGVPEPATWAMLIAGFGAIGGSLRRRRATPAYHVA